MRGVLHVHSIFSDGEESLERVVQTFRESGVSFAAVSDHAEVFDEERMQEYVALCAALSDDHFLVIPGLEFALKGGSIHILGYGISQRVRATTMEQLVEGIHSAGGIAVLAHPPVGSINMIGAIKGKLDGIEVWNGRYDGTVAPRADSFQLLRRIRSSNVKAAAYCGIDLHKIGQARKPIYVEVETDKLEREAIINALRSGCFTVRGNNMVIPSSGNLTFVQELLIAIKQPFCRPWAE
jgi:histidinol phosphatase-like PHP family hydrolase